MKEIKEEEPHNGEAFLSFLKSASSRDSFQRLANKYVAAHKDSAITAEDWLQDFLIHLSRKIEQFDPDRSVTFEAWCRRVAKNFFYSQAQRMKSRPFQCPLVYAITANEDRDLSVEAAFADSMEMEVLRTNFREYLVEQLNKDARTRKGVRNALLVYHLLLLRIDNPALTFKELQQRSGLSHAGFSHILNKIRKHLASFLLVNNL